MSTRQEAKEELKMPFLKILFRSLRLAWRTDKSTLAILTIGNALQGIISIGLLYLLQYVIDQIVIAQTTTQTVSLIVISFLAGRYFLLSFDFLLGNYLNTYRDGIFELQINNRVNLELNKKMAGLDIGHFENPETQNVIKKGDRSIWRIPGIIRQFIYQIYHGATFFAAVMAVWPYGYWIVPSLILAQIPYLFVQRKLISDEWRIFNTTTPDAKELSYLSGILLNPKDIQEIKVSNAPDLIIKKITSLQEKIYKESVQPLRQSIINSILPVMLPNVILFLIGYLALPSTVSGAVSVGSLALLLTAADRLLNAISRGVSLSNSMHEQALYIQYYFQVLDLPKIIEEKPDAYEFSQIAPPSIELRNVSFQYPDGKKALKNISLELKPGEHLAIVGPNGAGKTTLVKLLLRFYDPSEGSIKINGKDLKDIKTSNWYKFVGTLFQDFVQYWLTVRENITIGKPELKSDAKMIEAAKKSGAHEFIMDLPNTYDQRLGKVFEDSAELSKGQWQKLALARAFYEEPPVLILDEPTSAIDPEAEAQIFENLNTSYEGKSLVFISHRFSTVRNAHKIIVIEDGRITEEGDHKSLIAKKGTYFRMFTAQAKGYINEN